MKQLSKLLILFAILFLAACTPQIDSPLLSLSEGQAKEIKISSNAETATISFNANNSWTAISSESWLTISPSSGIAGMSTVSISAASNPNADPRSAKVTITSEGLSQSITVIQAQKDSFELKDTEFEIGSEGGTIKVPISANADYTIEVAADSKDWITVTKTKALSNYIIELTVAKNTNTNSRQGSVKVKMNGVESTITITQSQMDELIVDKKTFEIGSKGGPIYIPIKANIEYTSEILESGKGWIEISNNQTKGLEDYELVLNIKENKDYDGRVGQVKVSGAGKESVITITQSQLDEIIVTTTSYKIGSNGETFSVPIKANIDYEFSIISGDSWLKAEKVTTKGLEESTLLVTISNNETYDARNGQIKVYGSDKESVITINQSQLDELIVNTTSYKIGSDGGTITIPIEANVEYEFSIISGNEWLSVDKISPTKALTTSSIKVSVSKNDSYDGRNGQIKIVGAGKESVITITQSQLDELIVGKSTFEIGNDGGDISIPIETNIEYQYEILGDAASWIQIVETTTTKALESRPILLRVSKNEYMGRTGQVKITGAGKESVVTITQQESSSPYIYIKEKTCSFSCQGETINVEVLSNIDITPKIEVDWITIIAEEPLSGEKIGVKYSFKISPNTSSKERFSQIQFYNKNHNITENISITQERGELLTIPVQTPGTLLSKLNMYDKNYIKMLRVTGNINETDLKEVGLLENLFYLDISNTTLTTISQSQFKDNAILSVIFLPENLISIGNDAFNGCSSLTSITIPNSVTSIGGGAFYSCSNLASITIPDSVVSIGERAFYYCSSLTSITIPESVISVGAYAFFACISLRSIYCTPTYPPEGNEMMFYEIPTDAKIYVPRFSLNAYKSAEYWSYYSSKIEPYDY